MPNLRPPARLASLYSTHCTRIYSHIGHCRQLWRGIVVCALLCTPLFADPLTRQVPVDYSSAGYGGGGVAIPVVPARFRVALAPAGGDDTRSIQAALDAVAKLPLARDGFRGAVVLGPGTYHVSGQLKIRASGVVLRGSGDTRLVATGDSRRTLIEVAGRDDRKLGPAVAVTDKLVPAGATKLAVASVKDFTPGMQVLIRRPSTLAWIQELGMTQFIGPQTRWTNFKKYRLDWWPGTRDLTWYRTVVAVDPATRTLTLDAPITTALDARYGAGTVSPMTWPGRLHHVGVENLLCLSEFTSPHDEEHAWICVALDRVEDAWVRNVTARHFVCTAVWVGADAQRVTVQDCASEEPVSEIGGWRRVSYFVEGQQVLVQRCTADHGRCDFVTGHCAAGPNVFLDCQATRTRGDSGSFESWASGTLFDNVDIAGGALTLENLGEARQGAGWASANSVLWNCFASRGLRIEQPPGAFNFEASDYVDRSLYRTQLAARRGAAALAALAPTPPRQDPLFRAALIPPNDGHLLLPAGTLPPDQLATVPLAPPPPPPPAAPAIKPLEIIGGRFTFGGRAEFGNTMDSALWLGQLMPARARDMQPNPIRWAPGRVGPGLTENLNQLTNRMQAQDTPFYRMAPGLWYDRRRDSHYTGPWPDSDVWAPFLEMPWARSGEGHAWDGLSKYDLTKFNPWYFHRVQKLARLCAEKGLVEIYYAYHNHNLEEAAAHMTDYPWLQMNCIQKTGMPDPAPNLDLRHVYSPRIAERYMQFTPQVAESFYDTTNLAHDKLHRLLFDHGFDVLGDQPNVIHAVSFEFAGPLAFQQLYLDTAAAWQRAHHQRLHIALNTSKAVTDAILTDPVRGPLVDVVDMGDWQYLADGRLYAPDGRGRYAYRELRAFYFGAYDGDAAIPAGTPELVYRQVREYHDRYPDKALICGDAHQGPIPVLMAGGAGVHIEDAQGPTQRPPRNDLAFFQFVNTRLATALPHMNPRDDVTSDGTWCLTDGTRTWMFYSLRGAAIRLAHRVLPTAATSVWFNPRTGETTSARPGDGLTITKPTAEPWLLLVSAS